MHVSSNEKPKAKDLPGDDEYLDHLLTNGSQEGDSGTPLELPPWYDEQLFKRYVLYLLFVVVKCE